MEAVQAAPRGLPEGLWGRAVRARYQARQVGLFLTLGVALRLVYRRFEMAALEPPPPEMLEELQKRYRALLDQDLRNVEDGYYPRALLFQIPLADYAKRIPESLLDIRRIATRRRENNYQDLPDGIDLSEYPRYYRRNFHWQTDGWLSERSARLYDFEVELLFAGTADIMRRMAIPPVVRALRAVPNPRVLDVGTGTGRFLKQLHAALPAAHLTGLDLSPYYLKEAARVLRDVPKVSLVIENAEALPYRDESFDAVTSVFLFHELPRQVRRNVAREMFRVVRPGGTVVINDSTQLRESPLLKKALDDFAKVYHEPFYRDYLRDDLEKVFSELGFEVVSSAAHSVSKVLVARRPSSG